VGDRSTELVTYLPVSLLCAVEDGVPADLPWHREVAGTMVMADLSGFTNLSERLARLGDEGAERLTDTINSFFERMLKTASRYGGDTLTFGGDAILLLFDGPEHATRAAVAALEMLKQVERAAAVETDDGKVKIGMSVGAHSDGFILAGAGLAEERAHLVVLGRGAEMTALAEAQADRGQLAVSQSCKDQLPDGSVSTASGEFWRVDELGACALPRLALEPPATSTRHLTELNPFLPPYARSTGGSGGDGRQLVPEHRRTVIVFVNILGLNDVIERAGVDAAVDQLQAYSSVLTRIAARHQGFVVSSDIATRGSKLVVTFGAPVAHEYAPANAARFALDLNAQLRASGLDLRHKIGINGGHVFAGEVGPPFRRQYTVMGDAVNLAARLMGAAEPGEALVSRNLLNYVSHTLCARELAPIMVKGKEKPVAVCVLEEEGQTRGQIRGGLEPGRWEGRLFGRREELDLLTRSWGRARRGKGCAILVDGEAGVGKTRLLDEALRAMAADDRITRAACFEHLQAAPFTPWVDVLQSVLEIERDGPGDLRTATVQAYLDQHLPDLVEFGSLLNPLLNLSLSPSRVVGSLDAQTRRAKLFDLVARVLQVTSGDGGRILVLEDLHWMDESSLALVRHVTQRLTGAPILLLLTQRPAAMADDLQGAKMARVVVAELTEPESLAMIREALGVTDLPNEVGEAVYAKTRGNPLFLEEVIRSLGAPGVLERITGASSVTRAAELAALEIPDRVQGLLMSRIDALPAAAREVLKAGSVVGRSFGEAVLAGVDDELIRTVAIGRAFDELAAAALVVRNEDGDGESITFRHALVQDVAYDSLPFSRRRDLHGRVARYLESVQVTPDHPLLVHHYRHAGDDEMTRLHAIRASESSVAVAANVEAIDYLDIALGTVSARSSRDACLRSRLEELVGDSLETLARHRDAETQYVAARKRWASQSVRRASSSVLRDLSPVDDVDARETLLCWKIARSAEHGGSYRRALRWLDAGTRTLPPQRGGLAGRLLVAKSFCLYRLGRLQDSLDLGGEGMSLAREDGDTELQAYAGTIRSLTLRQLGLLDEAIDVSKEAVALYEEAGDLLGQANSHENLGACYEQTGDLQRALSHMELALTFSARLANTSGVAITHADLAAVLLSLGEAEEALGHLEETIGLRDHPDCPPGLIGWALALMSRALAMHGELEAAQLALDEGRMILKDAKIETLLLYADVFDAELRCAQGDLEQAERLCRAVMAAAQENRAEPIEGDALRVLGQVQIAKGDPKAAVAELEACVDLAAKVGADLLRAQALTVLAEAKAACADDDPACEDFLFEAIRTFRKLGARYDLEKALQVRARLQSAAG
jgi:class 3 adenylate cyclase/tetratricopeptide (TPR) repeat protein